MEKESLINALKERIGEPDFNAISRRSIETIIEPLMPMFAEDDKVTEDTYAIPVAMLKSFIGQSRHDIAEGIKSEKARFEAEKDQAVKDAVAALKAQMAKPDPKEPDPAATKGSHDDINTLIEQKMTAMLEGLTGKDGAIGKLTDSFNTFINDYNTKRQQERVEDLRGRVKSELVGLEDDRIKERYDVPFIVDLALRDVDFGKESAYADLLAEAKKRYEFYFPKFAPGVKPFVGGGNGESTDNSFQDYIKRQQKDAERQAEDARALREKMM